MTDDLALSLANIKALIGAKEFADARRALAEVGARLNNAPPEAPIARSLYEEMADLCKALKEFGAAADMYRQIERRFGADSIVSLDLIEALSQATPRTAEQALALLLPKLDLNADTMPRLVRIYGTLLRHHGAVATGRMRKETERVEERWIALDRQCFAAWFESARSSAYRGDKARARTLLQGARNCLDPKRPGDVHHWRDLHDFQLALHMAPESLESAVAGYRLDPTNSASLVRIGNVATKLGDLLSAAEIENVFERLLASSTRDTRYWIGLSGWLTKSGRMDAARLALERCLEIDPNHLAAQQLLSGLTHVGFAAASPTESDGTPVSPEPRRGLTRLFAGVRSILRR